MGDAVLLAPGRVRSPPGVDVLFLDTGYHFAETIGTRDAVAATLTVNARSRSPRSRPSPSRTPSSATAVRARPRPVLRDAQGRAAGRRARAATPPGPPGCAGTKRPPGRRPVVEWDAKRRHGQGQPASPPGPTTTSTRYIAEQRRAGQPAAVRRLPVDRLRAVHPAGGRGRGPARRSLGRPGKTECGLHV